MEKTNLVNFGYDVETAILEQIGKCVLMSSNLYISIETQKRYLMQIIVLKQLLATAKEFTETIKNDI